MPAPCLHLRPLALAPNQSPTSAELLLYGDIGESWDGRSIEAAEIVRQLTALPDSVHTIVVRINSYGGSVSDGLAIYNALLAHPARIEVRIDGVAASISSMVAMAGTEVVMPETSLLMVHAPWGTSIGNATDMRAFAEQLDQFARAMASAYARKTGSTVDAMLALLNSGHDHWFTAAEAIASGFADRMIDTPELSTNPAQSAFAPAALSRAPARIAAALRRPLIQEETTMPSPATSQPSNDSMAALRGAIRADPLAAAQDRSSRALAALDLAGDDPNVRRLVSQVLSASISTDDFSARLLAHLGAGSSPLGLYNNREQAADAGSPGDDFQRGAADALLLRAGIRIASPHPAARDLRNTSIIEIARASLSRSGRAHRGIGGEQPEAIIRAAMSTSDFPLILENALSKAVRQGVEAQAISHRTWCRVSEARDFKPQSRVLLGSAPDLEAVPELAEYTHGALAEDRASLTVGKFGKIIALSYEALVNDDLGAFLAVGPGLGLSALRAEADHIYDLITTAALDGVTMQDGNALFAGAHNNAVSAATGSGKPLTAAALSAARAKLRRQTGVGGALLNLAPKFLLVPPERESEAEILVASSTVSTSQAGAQALPGWMAGLTVISEPRLSNTDTLYVVADNQLIDTGEIAVLPGSPELLQEDSFDVDARRWKLRHSFATAILDHRGIVKLTLTAT